jgi:hypothetical protein
LSKGFYRLLYFPKPIHFLSDILRYSYLEPIDGAAIDQRWELSESVAEGFTYGAHTQHHMKIFTAAAYEKVEKS